MKKLLSLVLLFSAFCLFAGAEEEAVKKVYRDYHAAALEMNVSRVLTFLTDDFVEISADGKRVTRDEAKKMAAAVDALVEICGKKDPTIREIAMIAARLTGSELSEADLAQISELDKSPESRQQALLLQAGLRKQFDENKARLRSVWTSQEIISCKAEGGKAKLIFEMDSLMKPGKVETCEWEMVKTGGKWLVKKSVSRYKK